MMEASSQDTKRNSFLTIRKALNEVICLLRVLP